MNKLFKIGVILISVVTIAVIVITSLFSENGTHISYREFVQHVQNEKVESAVINGGKVEFKLVQDDVSYYTENPDTDGFKEFLLLNDVNIENSFGEDEFNFIFDILFYVFFFGIIGFGIYKLISFNSKGLKIIRNNKIKFNNVVGMEEIKKDLLKTVEVLKNPKEYASKGIRAPKGIILEGPPGNGKTLIAKALAGEADMNFIATKGADFQSAVMSIGPMRIKSLFRKARRNKPCIIFIDEFDGIGERRNYAGTGIDKENNRMITVLLNEMDGFASSEGVIVIAATNSYVSLDPALIRPGRFDKKYRVENPNKDEILELIKMYTKNKKLDDKIKDTELAKCFDKISASGIETILNEAAIVAEIKSEGVITIQDIAEAGRKTGLVNIKIS